MSAFPDHDFSLISPQNSPYSPAVYLNGAYSLYMLALKMGFTRFDQMMRGYVQQYEYRVADAQDFLRAASHAMGYSVVPYVRQYHVVASDDLTAPVLNWAKLEERENQRSWH